ncbi:MAG: leucine-rich repeat domain-containing protein [Bacteroidales bacterium]|nr:leucine-rich repeat domain-containing protein [Bacteroidales bacterium]
MRKRCIELMTLLVLLSAFTGCRKHEAQMFGVVATNEVVNDYGTIVEVSYSDNTKMYYRLLSETTAEVVNCYHFCLGQENVSPWVYRGDIIVPERFVHNGITYIVTSVGTDAFSRAGGWSLYYETISLISSVSIPHTVDTIRERAFKQCQNMTSINLPNSVAYIGDEAFWGTGLTSIDMSSSLTYIGRSAFSFSKLASMEIPGSVAEIAPLAFYSCKKLKTLICRPLVPPVLNSDVIGFLSDCDSLEVIYVPMESVERYKKAPEWRQYNEFIEGME